MNRLHPLLVLLLCLGCVHWIGCGGIDLGTSARRDLATALECPGGEVELEQLGEYRYRGECGGREATVACTSSALEPSCLVEGSYRLGQDREEVTEARPDVELLIRAGLDARRDDVLACVGTDRVGVRAAYTAEGVVSLALQGDLSESAEESCVRQVLAGVRVAATGEEGVVIHVVH